jgi:hypothetical protein
LASPKAHGNEPRIQKKVYKLWCCHLLQTSLTNSNKLLEYNKHSLVFVCLFVCVCVWVSHSPDILPTCNSCTLTFHMNCFHSHFSHTLKKVILTHFSHTLIHTMLHDLNPTCIFNIVEIASILEIFL